MTLRPVVIAIIAVSALLATPGGAAASCVQQGDAEHQARAEVILDGVILAAAKPGKARLRVSRYLKGHGPRELIIVGGSSAGAVLSIDVDPSAGERWRIFGALSEPGTIVTTVCDGSARIDELGPFAPVDHAPAAPVAPAQPGDRTPAWFAGLLAAAATASLIGVRVRRSRRSKPAEPNTASLGRLG